MASKMSNKIEDLAEGLLILSLVVGGIAVPIFLGTNTTGYSSTQLLAWGSILTISFAAVALMYIRHMRK